MNWQEVCEDPCLQDLPYKIELNHWGKIEMSPARNRHAILQGEIQNLIYDVMTSGKVFPECPIETEDNVKVADVVWVSDKRAEIIKDETASSIAPEICIEVKSESNTMKEMMFKKDLYLKAGADEFWLCDESGDMSFYNAEGQLDQSIRFPDFPKKIDI
ncbi:MAG: hypothetical protein IEMM0008_1336 [bacterium]|nr:MAG: hypothetical protein IEMM0008_1336 [bacterium]